MRSALLFFVALSLPQLVCAQADKLDALIDAGHFKQLSRLIDSSKVNDAETLYLLSNVKQAFGKTDEALQYAERAVKADPNRAKYHLQLADVLSDQAEKASLFKKISLAGRIKSELEAAVKLEPKNTDCLMGMMLFYQEAPGIAGGSKEKARQTAEEIGRIDASKGYLAQARLAAANNEKDKLEGLYLSAVKADPTSFEALMAIASFYASEAQKKYDEAEKYARQALQVDHTRSASYSISAQVSALKQNWTKLEDTLTAAEQANHDDLNPFYQAGRVLLQSNEELARAERYLRKYLSQDPEGLTPSLAAAHWRLGLILEKEGRKDDAIKELEESLRLQPDFENAKKDLKRIKD